MANTGQREVKYSQNYPGRGMERKKKRKKSARAKRSISTSLREKSTRNIKKAKAGYGSPTGLVKGEV